MMSRSSAYSWTMLVCLLWVSCSAMLTSCSNDVRDISQAPLCDVSVSFDGLDVSLTDDSPVAGPRKASTKSVTETSISRITLSVIDEEGGVVFSENQSDTLSTFGTIKCKLPVGTYTFVAIAHDVLDDNPSDASIISLTEGIVSLPLHPSLYSCSQKVTIEGNGSQDVVLEMGKRNTATFKVKVTDPTPSEVDSLQLIVSPSTSFQETCSFEPLTGLALHEQRFERTFDKASRPSLSFSNGSVNLCILLTSAEQELDILINALDDKGNILYSRSKSNVTFRQAATTTATGSLFSADGITSFLFDTEDNSTLTIPLD